jgi:CHAT domain-containing protein
MVFNGLFIKFKDQEKEDLMEQYRALTSEAGRLVSESKQSADKATNYRMEIVQREQSEREIIDKLRRLENEIEQVSMGCLW